MKAFYKGVLVGVLFLVLIGSSIVASSPREQNCNKTTAFSLSSNIETGTIRVFIQNNSVCKYSGFLTVGVGECQNHLLECTSPSNLKLKFGPFIKLYTFEPKTTETYTISKITSKDLKLGGTYYLVAFIEENNNGEAGFEFAKHLKEFVYGQL